MVMEGIGRLELFPRDDQCAEGGNAERAAEEMLLECVREDQGGCGEPG